MPWCPWLWRRWYICWPDSEFFLAERTEKKVFSCFYTLQRGSEKGCGDLGSRKFGNLCANWQGPSWDHPIQESSTATGATVCCATRGVFEQVFGSSPVCCQCFSVAACAQSWFITDRQSCWLGSAKTRQGRAISKWFHDPRDHSLTATSMSFWYYMVKEKHFLQRQEKRRGKPCVLGFQSTRRTHLSKFRFLIYKTHGWCFWFHVKTSLCLHARWICLPLPITIHLPLPQRWLSPAGRMRSFHLF